MDEFIAKRKNFERELLSIFTDNDTPKTEKSVSWMIDNFMRLHNENSKDAEIEYLQRSIRLIQNYAHDDEIDGEELSALVNDLHFRVVQLRDLCIIN